MKYIDANEAEAIVGSGSKNAPVIYAIDLPEHPFPIAQAARGLTANVV